eukprot:15460824-Alexandrium_andersonii.AAC.1
MDLLDLPDHRQGLACSVHVLLLTGHCRETDGTRTPFQTGRQGKADRLKDPRTGEDGQVKATEERGHRNG